MVYTPITDDDEVRNAFEWLRDAFQTDADREINRYSSPGYQHDRFKLWGAFSPMEKRYWIGFGNTDSSTTVFEANPPRSGADGRQGEGLFVKDDEGKRYLTHSGNFNLSKGHEAASGSREAFRKFIDSDRCWISVTEKKHKRFLITQLDVEASVLLEKVRGVVGIVEEFKHRYPKSKLRGAAKPNNVANVQQNQSLNTILYGPPGTGKTYVTARYCVEICDGPAERSDGEIHSRYNELVAEGRVEFITFHQSYGYEEFVEGLRPQVGSSEKDGGTGAGFRLVVTDGVLKRIAERARKVFESTDTSFDPADGGRRLPHVLVIDEINRANVSKVLGELITLLEEDKRQGAANEVVVTLTHSSEPFTLPPNLHILGTMNTADRSIALLDTALRRRFEFDELPPDLGKLQHAAEATGINLPEVLRAMNERLEWLCDRNHMIGHAWLMGTRTKVDVDRVMRHKIIPLIAEYFYDDWEKVRAVLGGGDEFVQSEKLAPPPDLDDAGENRYRWTVREPFPDGAYERLTSGQAPAAETKAE